MKNCRIWLRLDLPEAVLSSLREHFPAVEFVLGPEAESRLAEIDAVFTDRKLPDDVVQRMTRLRWLHVTYGGVYTFLSAPIVERPIQVSGSKGIHGSLFSEFGLACMFALAKKLPQCWDPARRGRDEQPTPEAMEGKTLGILGLGTAGSDLARKARCLGMGVIATKRRVADKPEYVDELGPPDYLPRLLPRADFVVICLPSVPSTEALLAEGELRSMKKEAYLINLTAAKAVEGEALLRALREGWIAGAALDVLPPDEKVARALRELPTVITSPRLGGMTRQKWSLIMPVFRDNLERFVAGASLKNVVDKALGY